MISERTLKRWRRDALKEVHYRSSVNEVKKDDLEMQLNERILRLTQELMDQHLMRKG